LCRTYAFGEYKSMKKNKEYTISDYEKDEKKAFERIDRIIVKEFKKTEKNRYFALPKYIYDVLKNNL